MSSLPIELHKDLTIGFILCAAAKPRFATFMRYAKVELIPPMPQELPEVARGAAGLLRGIRTRSYRNMTVREAWINAMVGLEVFCWFWVGECIGKGSLIGYPIGHAH